MQVGVEEEFHLVDAGTGRPAAAATRLLARLPSRGFTAEEKQTIVEANSEPHHHLASLYQDLGRSRAAVQAAAAAEDVLAFAAGTSPLGTSADAVGTSEAATHTSAACTRRSPTSS